MQEKTNQHKVSKDRLDWLESLRGIGCLFVLGAHLGSLHPQYGMYTNGCGKIGVWLFMVTSGFLLFYTRDGIKFGIKDVPLFYLSKVLRIYPIYIIGLFGAYYTGAISNLKSLVKHLLCLEGTGHFWYMAVILKFYLIAPIFLILYSNIKKKKYFYIGVALIGCQIAILFPFQKYIENSISIWWYLPVFIMGMILFVVYNIHIANGVVGDICAVIAALMIIMVTPFFRELLFGKEPSRFLQNKYLFIGLLWCVIIIGIKNGRYLKRFLDRAVILQYVGKWSFSIYIFHYIIMWKLFADGITWKWNVFIVIVASILIGFILNMCIEKPCRKLINLLKGRNLGYDIK